MKHHHHNRKVSLFASITCNKTIVMQQKLEIQKSRISDTLSKQAPGCTLISYTKMFPNKKKRYHSSIPLESSLFFFVLVPLFQWWCGTLHVNMHLQYDTHSKANLIFHSERQ